jgi:hypothetical protein
LLDQTADPMEQWNIRNHAFSEPRILTGTRKKGYTKTGLEIKSIVLRIAKTILIIRSSNVQSFDS